MMKFGVMLTLVFFLWPSFVGARETAPPLTDREIIERLSRLEEGQKRLEDSLRAEIRTLALSLEQFRQDVKVQFDRVDAQFDRIINVMLGILAAFTALAGVTISLMLWDRRTMIRPFEEKTKKMEEEFAQDRQNVHSLLDALRALGQQDEKVAEVLRRFRLL